MKLTIVAVGQKMPAWAQTAFDDYAKRFPPELPLNCKTVRPSRALAAKRPSRPCWPSARALRRPFPKMPAS